MVSTWRDRVGVDGNRSQKTGVRRQIFSAPSASLRWRWTKTANCTKTPKQSRYVYENTGRVSEICSAMLAFQHCGSLAKSGPFAKPQGHRADLALHERVQTTKDVKMQKRSHQVMENKGSGLGSFFKATPKRSHFWTKRTHSWAGENHRPAAIMPLRGLLK